MAHYIGTSGWSYKHWKEIFYPRGLPARAQLDHYVQHFRTVEVNNTFYRWPDEEVFAGWYKRLPQGFLMSVKASRTLTHMQRLRDPAEWLERMDRGLRRLEEHLGVLLIQLPPQFSRDLDRLAGFLEQAPGWIRLAFEFRHASWDREAVYSLLEEHQAAYCVTSGLGRPTILRATAPFVFVRLHGPDDRRYAGSYSDDSLLRWAERIQEWESERRTVFAYFNNDAEGHAVRNAQTLLRMLESS
ncbi:MAG TPA: DUF72 domain-containing protein [Isosphaeraceae bacterium]|jgi:uncharacterized protein YecE (DUF72 family)|nr:DUF72 domain-containing protein [Isosphaeraceae bacterium]